MAAELLLCVAAIGVPAFIAWATTPRTPDRRKMPTNRTR
jgi:hypothetical protein